MPRVSILIPTFDRPARLRECIAAALRSTFADIEVVVGDDGRLGRAVCASIPDPRLHYVANPARLGMAQNWNALMDAARGELLALCMDDDRLAPRFVETCVRTFDDAGPAPAVVFTNHTFADDAGNERIRRTQLRPGHHDDFTRNFMLQPAVAVSAAMITRTAWKAVRPLPDTAAADMILFGRMAELGLPFYYVDAPLMSYGIHAGQLSGTLGFRNEAVAAWSALRFSDEVAERERLRVLGRALTARAALRLREGRRPDARSDLRSARTQARAPLPRLALLHAVAFVPGPALGAAIRLRRWLRSR